MLYGSKTWRLQMEMAILKKTEKAMIKVMCGVKLLERRSSQELTDLLGLEVTLYRLAKANRM